MGSEVQVPKIWSKTFDEIERDLYIQNHPFLSAYRRVLDEIQNDSSSIYFFENPPPPQIGLSYDGTELFSSGDNTS